MPRLPDSHSSCKTVLNRGGPRPALEITHAGVLYRVAIKRVATARRFTLRVRAATQDAVLTMPSRASLRTAVSFAERHAEWIGTRLRGLPGRIGLAPGVSIPLRGVEHRVVHDPARGGRAAVRIARPEGEDCFPLLRVSGAPEHVGRTLIAFLRREALGDLTISVRRHARALAKTPGRLSIRDTRSRWGSCSAQGNLNFSWRLIMAPPFVLDYLAAHEVAHLCHMNHSADFWSVTERLAPQTPEAQNWLKTNGQSLHRFTAPPT